ncbi:unnamed protein product [Lupinus luteus]|uniref:Uncharacterized protein n=1 Tax=Lupinus luteus TaxID=3873 RepID=A0AAV1VQU3_LUPLU
MWVISASVSIGINVQVVETIDSVIETPGVNVGGEVNGPINEDVFGPWMLVQRIKPKHKLRGGNIDKGRNVSGDEKSLSPSELGSMCGVNLEKNCEDHLGSIIPTRSVANLHVLPSTAKKNRLSPVSYGYSEDINPLLASNELVGGKSSSEASTPTETIDIGL